MELVSQCAYRALEAGAVGEVTRGTELLSYHHGGPEEQSLTHAHHPSSRVVKRQRRVEYVVVPKAEGIVYTSCYKEIAEKKE